MTTLSEQAGLAFSLNVADAVIAFEREWGYRPNTVLFGHQEWKLAMLSGATHWSANLKRYMNMRILRVDEISLLEVVYIGRRVNPM